MGNSPLHEAASRGHKAVAKLLVEMGAKPDQANDYGLTPLQYATMRGHVGLAQFLLDRGAEPRNANEEGYTPINSDADETRFLLYRTAKRADRSRRVLNAHYYSMTGIQSEM